MFIQDAPGNPDLFRADAALQLEMKRRLPAAIRENIWPRLEALGVETATTLPRLADQAEREEPVHVPYSPFGHRVDEIRCSAAWDELKRFSVEHRVVSTGYEDALGAHRRVAQAGVLYLFSASSATFSCPLAMTDAAAVVLRDSAPAELKERLYHRLTSTSPEDFITSGQWMTERPGGSDVGRTETVARPDGDAHRLYGVKWFTSSTTSEMALTLARVDDGSGDLVQGSRGLTLFCVEVKRDATGALEGIQVNRLKDKLGTKALPTAELTLDGVRAWQIGDAGRGVATISAMLNITRWYNALASASGMARATFLARDYATRREAFGKMLEDQPLHARTLDGIEAITAGALVFACEIAELLGRAEADDASDEEIQRLRGLIPIAKLTTGKQAVLVASEALECFGGAGYVEDSGLPRLLRDAQVLPIWEGTTNVLSLDVLRAEQRAGALSAVVADVARRAEALSDALDADARAVVLDHTARLGRALRALGDADRSELERQARRVARTVGHLVQAVLLGEAAAHAEADDKAGQRFADFTREVLTLGV